MKAPDLFLLTTIIICSHISAQRSKETPISVDNEDQQKLLAKGVYRFPEFRTGTVVFKKGEPVTVLLNYNIWLEEMHFIGEKGDTLAIETPGLVNFIDINGSRFYYDINIDKGKRLFEKGYLEEVEKYGQMVLAVKQELSAEEQRKGAFGVPTLSNSVKPYDMYASDGQSYQLGRNADLLVTSKVYYFLGDSYNHFSTANKEYIIQKFPQKRNAIEDFVTTNNIKFNKLTDLQKLLAFCNNLQ